MVAGTLFTRPKIEYLADIIELDDPGSARGAASKLRREFWSAKTRDKKVRVKRATVQAQNRAGAILNKKNLSRREKIEFRQIQNIYKKAQKGMRL